jgi:hypothetical protein
MKGLQPQQLHHTVTDTADFVHTNWAMEGGTFYHYKKVQPFTSLCDLRDTLEMIKSPIAECSLSKSSATHKPVKLKIRSKIEKVPHPTTSAGSTTSLL